MDPHYHNLAPNNSILSHVFERLIEPDEQQRLTPGLAESWKLDRRHGVGVQAAQGRDLARRLAIHGRRRGVHASSARPRCPTARRSFAAAVKDKTVKKIDDYTVHISASTISPTLPNDLSSLLIVSKKYGEGARTEDYNSGKAAIGTGPYKFVKFTPATASSSSATMPTGARSPAGPS